MTKVKTDLHNHWRTSSAISKRTAERGVEIAARRLGARGIVGLLGYDSSKTKTDPRWISFITKAPYDLIDTGNGVYIPEKELFVLHGQEVHTKEGFDMLVLGNDPKDHFYHGMSLEELASKAKEVNALTVITAPFHKGGSGEYLEKNEAVIAQFDGIETFNGEAEWSIFGTYPHANSRARTFFRTYGKKYGLFELCSSDGHSPEEIGYCSTMIDLDPSIQYTELRGSPDKLNALLREGLRGTKSPVTHRRLGNYWGGVVHARDLAVLIAANKVGLGNLTPKVLEKMSAGLITI